MFCYMLYRLQVFCFVFECTAAPVFFGRSLETAQFGSTDLSRSAASARMGPLAVGDRRLAVRLGRLGGANGALRARLQLPGMQRGRRCAHTRDELGADGRTGWLGGVAGSEGGPFGRGEALSAKGQQFFAFAPRRRRSEAWPRLLWTWHSSSAPPERWRRPRGGGDNQVRARVGRGRKGAGAHGLPWELHGPPWGPHACPHHHGLR